MDFEGRRCHRFLAQFFLLRLYRQMYMLNVWCVYFVYVNAALFLSYLWRMKDALYFIICRPSVICVTCKWFINNVLAGIGCLIIRRLFWRSQTFQHTTICYASLSSRLWQLRCNLAKWLTNILIVRGTWSFIITSHHCVNLACPPRASQISISN